MVVFENRVTRGDLEMHGFSLVGGRDSDDDRHRAGAAAPTLAVMALAAEIGVIHFDTTIERLPGVAKTSGSARSCTGGGPRIADT